MGSFRLGQSCPEKVRVLVNKEDGLGSRNAKGDPRAVEAESDGKME
jgi:hypothetical protein